MKKLIAKLIRRLVGFYKLEDDIRKINNYISLYDKQFKQLYNEENSIVNKQNEMSEKLNYINQNIETYGEYNIYLHKENEKKNLLIMGFFGAPNLGDELMLETMLENIDCEKINITIMLCNNNFYDITKFPKCNFIHYPKNGFSLNLIAENYDEFLICGGALLDDNDFGFSDKELSLCSIITNLSLRAFEFKKNVFFYGVSCNKKIKNKEFINKIQKIIYKSKYFSLRDMNSLSVLQEAGIDTNNIKIVNDIVIANKKLLIKEIGKEKNIGVVLICNDRIYDKLESIINSLDKVFDDTYNINLIPFYDYRNNDIRIYTRLVENKSKKFRILDMPSDMDDTIEIFKEQQMIISMRYHGTLIANFVNKPTINVYYDIHDHYQNKVKYLYSNYGFENNELEFSKLTEENLNKIIVKNINKKVKNDVDSVIKNASEELGTFIAENIFE